MEEVKRLKKKLKELTKNQLVQLVIKLGDLAAKNGRTIEELNKQLETTNELKKD